MVWFQIETEDSAFVVDQDTGDVSTAGVFRGLSGTTLQVQVRAFDNFGIPPTLSTVDTLSVSFSIIYGLLCLPCIVVPSYYHL